MTKLLSASLILFGLALPATSLAQTAPSKDFLPPAPAGKQWKLIWHDEFDGTQLDETKWNRLGDHPRKGGWWLKEDAYLSGKGTLLLRTRKGRRPLYVRSARHQGQVRARLRLLRGAAQNAQAAGPLACLLDGLSGCRAGRQRRPRRHGD